jgi:urease accessory protein
MQNAKRLALAAVAFLAATPAFAHIGVGPTAGLAAGFAHPLTGVDHLTVMVAVGLWAALKGGRALWAWPAAFVGVMLIGGALGMAHFPLPFVEPAIMASVVALGILVAIAADLPVWTGAVIVGLFALFHGHAHGTEAAENLAGIQYMAGFASATALLHGVGIAIGLLLGQRFRPLVRFAGAGCAVVGVALATGMLA